MLQITRASKALLVFAVGFLFSLIVFNNLADPKSNLEYVSHVITMDTLPAQHPSLWRALRHPVMPYLFFAVIVAWESAAALLCLWGSYKLVKCLNYSSGEFYKAKAPAAFGLALVFSLIVLAFVAVGSEWFCLWQTPPPWNGALENATRLCTISGLALAILLINDP